MAAESDGRSAEDLDHLLAFAPWRDGGQAYVTALSEGWIRQNLVLDGMEKSMRNAHEAWVTSKGAPPRKLRNAKTLDKADWIDRESPVGNVREDQK